MLIYSILNFHSLNSLYALSLHWNAIVLRLSVRTSNNNMIFLHYRIFTLSYTDNYPQLGNNFRAYYFEYIPVRLSIQKRKCYLHILTITIFVGTITFFILRFLFLGIFHDSKRTRPEPEGARASASTLFSLFNLIVLYDIIYVRR